MANVVARHRVKYGLDHWTLGLFFGLVFGLFFGPFLGLFLDGFFRAE